MADVRVYVNRPAGKEGTDLEDLEEALRKLEYVSGVELNPPGNVAAVSYRGRAVRAGGDRARRRGSRLRGLEDLHENYLR